MTLYEINEQIRNTIDAAVDPDTGEVLSAFLFAALDALEVARETKLENALLYIKALDADAAAIKLEESALRARRKAKESRAESLRDYISQALAGAKFETPRVAVAWRRSEAVDISDETMLPKKYFKVIIERKPDKTAIKAALKQGLKVRGACLAEHNNMQIK